MSVQDDLRQILADQRLLVDRLEQVLAETDWASAAIDKRDWPVFDPDLDEPPVRPDVLGDRTQRDWVVILLWLKLAAINVRQHRGAWKEEYTQISRDAGYKDGRGWNAWKGWIDLSDGRWAESTGMETVQEYLARRQVAMPADIARWVAEGCSPE